MTPHVGMKVWAFDVNRRVYRRDENGRAVGGPIWREHWAPRFVIGETRVSWLVGDEFMLGKSEWFKRADKIAKKDWPGSLALSEEDIDRRAFVEGRWALADRIKSCTDYDTLKKIEAALDGARK